MIHFSSKRSAFKALRLFDSIETKTKKNIMQFIAWFRDLEYWMRVSHFFLHLLRFLYGCVFNLSNAQMNIIWAKRTINLIRIGIVDAINFVSKNSSFVWIDRFYWSNAQCLCLGIISWASCSDICFILCVNESNGPHICVKPKSKPIQWMNVIIWLLFVSFYDFWYRFHSCTIIDPFSNGNDYYD